MPIAKAVAFAHDQISLPVPGLKAIGDRGRASADHRHRGQPTPAAKRPLRRPRQRRLRVVDGLVDTLGAQLPLHLVGEPHPQFVGDLLGTPLLCQELSRPPWQGRGRSSRGALVGAPVERPRFAGPRFSRYLCWRSQLRRSSRLIVDTARPSSAAVAVKRAAVPVQIGDRDPLLKREVPHRRRLGSSSQGLHSGILQPLAGPVDDCSPVPPARPGTPVHADDPTDLRVAHPLLDQAYELLTLPRKNIPPMMPIALFHHVHRTPRSISALRRSLESTASRWGQCKSSLRFGGRSPPVGRSCRPEGGSNATMRAQGLHPGVQGQNR